MEWIGMEWNGNMTKHIRILGGEVRQVKTTTVQTTFLHPSAVPS